VELAQLKMTATGFEKIKNTKYNGIGAYYHFVADPMLPMGVLAARRIPCACVKCIEKQNLPWDAGVLPKDQGRYSRNTECVYFDALGKYNDWSIIQLKADKKNDEPTLIKARQSTLRGFTARNAASIVAGNVGAFSTNDPEADGYYLVTWTSPPYTLQEKVTLREYDPPAVIAKGELVADAIYWSKVNRAPNWYMLETDSAKYGTMVVLRHVLVPDVGIHPQSDFYKLPFNLSRSTKLRYKDACKIEDVEHDTIMDEAKRRTRIEFYEEVASDEESDDNSLMDDYQDDEESDSDAESVQDCIEEFDDDGESVESMVELEDTEK